MTPSPEIRRRRSFRSAPARLVVATVLLAILGLAACGEEDDTSATGGRAGDETVGDSPSPTTASPADGGGDADDTTADGDAAEGGGDEDPPLADWPDTPLTLLTVAELEQPIALVARPGSDDLWVAERPGRVRLIERSIDAAADTEEIRLVDQPVVDMTDQISTDGEGGLLGLAFAPDGSELYVHYTDRSGDTVVSALTVEGQAAALDSERVLLAVDQPYSNHNGGDLHLGPDGHLYIGLGDGGSGGDPEGNGQDTTTLLGSILRIDPDGGDPYAVPADNPFIDDGTARPEIWLYGARNPWRFAFDAATGDLWVADVGQNEIEEINLLPATDGGGGGANLGWNRMEGDQVFEGEEPADHVPPIHTYDHSGGGCSVTGGEVYRGSMIPALDGIYLYSDYCTGGVVGIEAVDGALSGVAAIQVEPVPSSVIAFGRDAAGEVYILEQNGRVSRLQPVDGGPSVTVARG